MRTETALKVEAINVLIKTFGVLETERFITSIKSSNFDYTEWHKDLWKDKTIEEIHTMAAEFENRKYHRHVSP
jgi:hypothetical protein